jgi:succinate dehydrogenase / fumarate reductase, iron-sulfur subunit
MNSEQMKVKVFRFYPGVDLEPRFDEYLLPYSSGATILGILRYIYENLDPTLAFRQYYCAAMLCGCCRVTVNGERTKSCVARVQPGATVVIEPYDRSKVIRDLAVKFDDEA